MYIGSLSMSGVFFFVWKRMFMIIFFCRKSGFLIIFVGMWICLNVLLFMKMKLVFFWYKYWYLWFLIWMMLILCLVEKVLLSIFFVLIWCIFVWMNVGFFLGFMCWNLMIWNSFLLCLIYNLLWIFVVVVMKDFDF